MISIKELDSLSADEIKSEIKQRLELMKQMVGALYPAIVFDEVVELRKKYAEIAGEPCPC